jgi:hypothetical protein
MLCGGRGEERVVIGKGTRQWGGQGTIMMCGCDGGWNGGDGSLKSIFEWIQAINHRFQPYILLKIKIPDDEGVWKRGTAMDCCHGQAIMVRVDHVNSWWGVELLIPQLKHTNELYFVGKFHV